MIGVFVALCAAIGVALGRARSENSTRPRERAQPLALTDAIPLEGIKGRFDHFGYGGAGCLLLRRAAMQSRSSASEPEHRSTRSLALLILRVLVYSPESNKLFVASGSAGKVYIYDGTSQALITTVLRRNKAYA